MKQNHTRAIIFRILTILYIVAVAWLCFANFSKAPQMPRTLFGLPIDKVVHFLMFFPFPVLFYFAFCRPSSKAWHGILLTFSILILGGLFAAGTEYVQGFLPYREADASDFLADSLALCLSSIIVLLIALKKSVRHA